MMSYFNMPDWILADKTLSSSSKLLMQMIFTISENGQYPVNLIQGDCAEKLGVSKRTISNSLKELIAHELITATGIERITNTRFFEVTEKACGSEQPRRAPLNKEVVAYVYEN